MVGNASAVSYTLTLTSSGSQSVDVSPATGTAISSDAINVTTTCRYGYNFTIQTSVDDTTLYLNGDIDSPAYTVFSPAGGFDPLNETENEWGYFYDGNTVPTNTSIFSPVPSSLEEPAIIKAPLDSPASSDINDNFNIYYGVSASANAEKGTYKMIPDEHDNDGTIVYIATVAEDCLGYTIQFEPGGQTWIGGEKIVGTGTMGDQIIPEDTTAPLSPVGFTAPSGYYFAGWNTREDGTGTVYTDQQQVTNLGADGETVHLFAMWTDCPANRICYSANVSNPSDVVGEMGDQTMTSTDTARVLYASNYKRNGYGFAGWNTKPDGSGTNYGPNHTLQFTAGQYNIGGLRLYAIWIASAGNMQNWSGCSGMNIGDVTALKDTRDSDVYAVAKLADGKCWMIENLRLADKDNNNNWINLSRASTHSPLLPFTNTWYYRSSQTTATTSDHLSPTSDPTQAYEVTWCTMPNTSCINQSMLATNNTAFFVDNASSNYDVSKDVYIYGNYYNWNSATAGNGSIGASYGSGYVSPGDICPIGWHLPKGGDKSRENTNEFWQLVVIGINNGVKPNNYNDETKPYYTGSEGSAISKELRLYPNNFVYSGNVSGGLNNRGSTGLYWSSAGFDDANAHDLYFYNDNVSPGTSTARKYTGRAVRCIAGT